ncbi:MAG: galactokinase [Chloroflexota bacterium]
MKSTYGTVDLKSTLITAFTEHYGKPAYIAQAPGRVNIIGEHTDYNDGFVLPAAIDRAIFIAGRLRSDNVVNVISLDYHSEVSFTLDQLQDKSLPNWTNYLRGTLWVLRENGNTLHGMDLAIAGNVPSGAGFSSSAAFEVAMFEMTAALFGLQLTRKQKALLGVEVEHKYIGVPTGSMDQLISALGEEGHALLIDCRSLATTSVPIPDGVSLVALDTGKRRELVHSEYGKRRAQCEEAARLLGVAALRDVTPEQLAANADKLPEVIERRAAHVVNEDVRTLATVEAFKAGDLKTVGRLINESHASLRDLFQISIPELDIMAELAQKEPGCYGARMMGGGFGGAVIALVEDDAVQSLSRNVAEAYNAATHLQAYIYAVKAGPGSSAEQVS